MSVLWEELRGDEVGGYLSAANPESWADYLHSISAHTVYPGLETVLLGDFTYRPIRLPAAITQHTRWTIWDRDNFQCQICGSRKFLAVDHIYPKSRGGPTIPENLQTLCKSCNSSKSNRVLFPRLYGRAA